MPNVQEVLSLCLVRVPPGDRWRFPNGTEIFDSLTIALEESFQQNGVVNYKLNAREGKVWRIEEKELEPVPQKRYSIYGDE